jgi:hypothetical protein
VTYDLTSQVIRACERVGAEYKLITGDQAKQIYQTVDRKFFVPEEYIGQSWDKRPPAVPKEARGFVEDGWRHVQYLTQSEPIYLMFDYTIDANILFFEDSSLISKVLGEIPSLEFFVSDISLNYLIFEDKHNVFFAIGEKAIQWLDNHNFRSVYLIGATRYKSDWYLSSAPIPTWILDYLAYNPELSLKIDPNAATVAKNNLLIVDENNAEEFIREIRFYKTFPEHIRHSLEFGFNSEEDLQLSVMIDFDDKVYINNYPEEPLQGYIPAHWTGYSGSPLEYVPEDIRAIWEEPLPEVTETYNNFTKSVIDACEKVGAKYQLMTGDQSKQIYEAADQKFFTQGRPNKRWGKLGLSLEYTTKEGSGYAWRRIGQLTQGESIYLMFDRYRDSNLFLFENGSLIAEVLDKCLTSSSFFFISNISLDYLIFEDSRGRVVATGEKAIQWVSSQEFYEPYIIGAVKHQANWQIFDAPIASWVLNHLLYNPKLSSLIDRYVQEVVQNNLLEVDETNAEEFLTAIETYKTDPTEIQESMLAGYEEVSQLAVVIDFDNKVYVNNYPKVPLQDYIPIHWAGYTGSPIDYVPDDIKAIWKKPLPAL